MVCPNCAATLETHCGRNPRHLRTCAACGEMFVPSNRRHRYCSAKCIGAANGARLRRVPRAERRKVERPPYDQLMEDLRTMSFCAVGRKYGVSDNAVRKWIRWYERGKMDPGETQHD